MQQASREAAVPVPVPAGDADGPDEGGAGERSVFFREGSCIFLLFDRTAAALRRMNEELGLTVLLTERNVNFALHPAGDIHVLETGRIRLRGTAAELREQCPGPAGMLRSLKTSAPRAEGRQWRTAACRTTTTSERTAGR